MTTDVVNDFSWLDSKIATGRYAHITWRERFWVQVGKTFDCDCWSWNGKLFTNGYGCMLGPKAKSHLAHRVSFFVANGYIDSSLIVCHSCDNPRCVNPAHLWLGTAKDNMADCLRKNRFPHSCTRAMANDIRYLYTTGHYTQRQLGVMYGISQQLVSLVVNGKGGGLCK